MAMPPRVQLSPDCSIFVLKKKNTTVADSEHFVPDPDQDFSRFTDPDLDSYSCDRKFKCVFVYEITLDITCLGFICCVLQLATILLITVRSSIIALNNNCTLFFV